MNDIKVGEYIRLARNQGINRVEKVKDDYYVLEDFFVDDYGDETCCLYKYKVAKEVLKHSPNIIDLIEVGDYVNGKRVIDKWEEPDWREYFIKLDGEETVPTMRNIESIVTKEQFNSIKYTLGGKNE